MQLSHQVLVSNIASVYWNKLKSKLGPLVRRASFCELLILLYHSFGEPVTLTKLIYSGNFRQGQIFTLITLLVLLRAFSSPKVNSVIGAWTKNFRIDCVVKMRKYFTIYVSLAVWLVRDCWIVFMCVKYHILLVYSSFRLNTIKFS